MWLGIDDIATENEWIAADGTALTYRNWHSQQPDNYGNSEDAVHFWGPTHQGLWNDANPVAAAPVHCTYRP